MKQPLISIVSVVYNEPLIEKTILSIIPFVSDNLEYIIIDGGSTDGTIDIINKYINKINKFISEKDYGIYDAMNKASNICSGYYILHINAGDLLVDIPFSELEILKDMNYSAIAYPVFANEEFIFMPEYNSKLKFTNTIHHQGTFYKRDKVKYNISYKVFSDFDLNQKMYLNKENVLVKQSPIISIHFDGGIASGGKHRWECYRIIINNFGISYLIIYFIYRLKNRMKNIFSNSIVKTTY